MGDVVRKLLIPLAETLGKMPNEAAVGAYEEVCGKYPDDVLDKARLHILETFVPSKFRPWPAPAVCAKACKELVPETIGPSDFVAGLRKRDAEAQAFAWRWQRQTGQGRTAEAEGWDHEARALVRQLYAQEVARAPVAPADIVIDGATVEQYRRAYGAKVRVAS